MKRRNFISENLVAGTLIPAAYASLGLSNQKVNLGLETHETGDRVNSGDGDTELVIERVSEDQPHKGKTLAV
ncbi:MAG: hypothetical protein ABI472_19180, partial [Ginsengibacter sp.]